MELTQENNSPAFSASLNLSFADCDGPHIGEENILGTYIGSGLGEIESNLFRGKIRWDLFENQGPSACPSNFRMEVITDEGKKVFIDSLGFFIRGEDHWNQKGTVMFSSEDVPELNGLTAFLSGVFELSDYRHRYTLSSETAE